MNLTLPHGDSLTCSGNFTSQRPMNTMLDSRRRASSVSVSRVNRQRLLAEEAQEGQGVHQLTSQTWQRSLDIRSRVNRRLVFELHDKSVTVNLAISRVHSLLQILLGRSAENQQVIDILRRSSLCLWRGIQLSTLFKNITQTRS